MRVSKTVAARSALVLMLAGFGIAGCSTPNPTVANPGLQQDRAGKENEKDKSTKDQNPTKPVGL
jgi:hypothetical protein